MNATKGLGVPAGGGKHLDTPAAAGGYVEELLNRRGPMNDDEHKELRERYRWETVGPNPL